MNNAVRILLSVVAFLHVPISYTNNLLEQTKQVFKGSTLAELIQQRTAKTQEGGFLSGTPVSVSKGNSLIEELKEGDEVLSYNDVAQVVQKPITHVAKYTIHEYFKIIAGDQIIYAAPSQKFLVETENDQKEIEKKWIEAKSLTSAHRLLKNVNETLAIKEIEKINDDVGKDVHIITIKDQHNYCVGNENIHTHNIIPVFVATIPIVIETATPIVTAATHAFGIMAVGGTSYFVLTDVFRKWKKERSHQEICSNANPVTMTPRVDSTQRVPAIKARMIIESDPTSPTQFTDYLIDESGCKTKLQEHKLTPASPSAKMAPHVENCRQQIKARLKLDEDPFSIGSLVYSIADDGTRTKLKIIGTDSNNFPILGSEEAKIIGPNIAEGDLPTTFKAFPASNKQNETAFMRLGAKATIENLILEEIVPYYEELVPQVVQQNSNDGISQAALNIAPVAKQSLGEIIAQHPPIIPQLEADKNDKFLKSLVRKEDEAKLDKILDNIQLQKDDILKNLAKGMANAPTGKEIITINGVQQAGNLANLTISTAVINKLIPDASPQGKALAAQTCSKLLETAIPKSIKDTAPAIAKSVDTLAQMINNFSKEKTGIDLAAKFSPKTKFNIFRPYSSWTGDKSFSADVKDTIILTLLLNPELAVQLIRLGWDLTKLTWEIPITGYQWCRSNSYIKGVNEDIENFKRTECWLQNDIKNYHDIITKWSDKNPLNAEDIEANIRTLEITCDLLETRNQKIKKQFEVYQKSYSRFPAEWKYGLLENIHNEVQNSLRDEEIIKLCRESIKQVREVNTTNLKKQAEYLELTRKEQAHIVSQHEKINHCDNGLPTLVENVVPDSKIQDGIVSVPTCGTGANTKVEDLLPKVDDTGNKKALQPTTIDAGCGNNVDTGMIEPKPCNSSKPDLPSLVDNAVPQTDAKPHDQSKVPQHNEDKIEIKKKSEVDTISKKQAENNGQNAEEQPKTGEGRHQNAKEMGGEEVWDLSENGRTINGRFYTKHALERMAPDCPYARAVLERRAQDAGHKRNSKGFKDGVQPRGIPPMLIEEVIAKTKPIQGQNQGTVEYLSDGLKIVTNLDGDVITVHPQKENL